VSSPIEGADRPADYRAMSGTSFRFRLERVRALRERSEDAAKQALAEAMQGHHVASEALGRAQAQVAAAQAAQTESASGRRSMSDLVAHQAFLERSERAVLASRQDLTRHEHHLEQRRHELSEAARERQALERLKENRRADHDRELARREALDLDEIAINGFRRRAA
jgi:flagellar FliJ protein